MNKVGHTEMSSPRPSWLDNPDSVVRWQANIAALRTVSPALAARLETAPLGDRHSFEDLRAPSLPTPHGDRLGVFGLGDPAVLKTALATKATRIVAWDRDPALVHFALSALDCTPDILSERLQIALGADVVHYLEGLEWTVHPQLGLAYAGELALLGRPLPALRVLVGTGTLFVDDLVYGLQQKGYAVYPLATALHSVAELDHTVQTIKPQAIFTINYLHGIAEFCVRHQVPFRCWEIDPATDQVSPFKEQGDVHIFTYRQANVGQWQAKGYPSSYLPLASNPDRRTPGTQQPRGISFVGTSMVQTAASYFVRLVQLLGSLGHDEVFARHSIEHILLKQSQANSYIADGLLATQFPSLPTTTDDPAMWLGEVAASRHRIQAIQQLAELNIDVWGDAGWAQMDQTGVHYKGPAGHFHQLNDIYRSSLINIDIGRIYQPDIVTMRVFDVLACGGFVLAAHCEALAELFEVGQEVDSWKTMEELRDKTTWYLKHPQQAQAIAQRGREKILSQHNIGLRVQEMLESI